jgi:hypothetical protein
MPLTLPRVEPFQLQLVYNPATCSFQPCDGFHFITWSLYHDVAAEGVKLIEPLVHEPDARGNCTAVHEHDLP